MGYFIDNFFIDYSSTNKTAFLVQKINSDGYSGINSRSQFGYLRSKHYLHNEHKVHLLLKPNYGIISCSVHETYLRKEKNIYGKPILRTLDIKNKLRGVKTWFYICIEMD